MVHYHDWKERAKSLDCHHVKVKVTVQIPENWLFFSISFELLNFLQLIIVVDSHEKCEVGQLAGWLTSMAKHLRLQFLRHYIYDKCWTLLGGTTHWTLPAHTTFGNLYHVSNSFSWKFSVLIWLSWNFIRFWICLVYHEYITFCVTIAHIQGR